ncbi:MAG: hypothetical protein H0X24_13995 [Ktedonobacterales bacterium]|nr:hypothetical protein [Ktedonobacterales bacterium]
MQTLRARRGCNPFYGLGQRFTRLNVIIFALVFNTGLAQLFYNSAGVILPNSDWRARYLIFSAVLSMTAFSLFELHIVRQLKELMGRSKEVRAQFPRLEIPSHVLTLAAISLYNIYSLALLNAAIWPDLHLAGIPELPKPEKYYFHAIMYSLILFLAAIVGERKRTAAEQAAEEDDHLQAEMVHKSNEHYRGLIAQGGRNVVKARQVLSTPDQAKQQEALLAALEGGTVLPVAPVPVADPPAAADEADEDDEEEQTAVPSPGRMRFTRKKAEAVEQWALGTEARE